MGTLPHPTALLREPRLTGNLSPGWAFPDRRRARAIDQVPTLPLHPYTFSCSLPQPFPSLRSFHHRHTPTATHTNPLSEHFLIGSKVLFSLSTPYLLYMGFFSVTAIPTAPLEFSTFPHSVQEARGQQPLLCCQTLIVHPSLRPLSPCRPPAPLSVSLLPACGALTWLAWRLSSPASAPAECMRQSWGWRANGKILPMALATKGLGDTPLSPLSGPGLLMETFCPTLPVCIFPA